MSVNEVSVTPGSGKNVATYEFTDTDSTIKEAQRVAFNDSSGNQIGITSNPIFTSFDDTTVSAFGDLIAVDNTPVVQLDFVYGINTQTGITTVANSATVDTNASRLRLQTGTNSAGSAIFNSRRIAKYRAGQGMTARFTPVFTTGVASSTQIIGVGNANDGYFFGYNGISFGIDYRYNGSDTWTAQSGWNIDKCDGTGLSGFNWNPTYGTPVMIRYPYLGYGDIKFFVQNPANGRWILCHIIKYADTTASTQATNPNLFFYAQALNSGNTSNLTMYCGSVGLFVSGDRSFIGCPHWGIDNNKNTITAETSIVTLQNATTYNGITNRTLVRLNHLSWGSTAGAGNATVRFKINPTLGGSPSYTPINGSTSNNGVTITSGNSIVSYDTAGTTVASGTLIFNAVLVGGVSDSIDLTPYELFIAPTEILTISVFSTNSTSVTVAINWSEE